MSTEPEAESLSREELEEAWAVLSVAERLEGFRCLERPEGETFFMALSAPDRATLLIDMEAEERAEWLKLMPADDVVESVQALAEPDAGLLIDMLEPPAREDVNELLAEEEAAEPTPPEEQEESPASDITSAQVHIYKTLGGKLSDIERLEPGVWVNLVNPSVHELSRLSELMGVELDLLKAALDEEERPRVSVENGATLILVDLPAQAREGGLDLFTTIPLGIVLNGSCVATVCLRGDTLLDDFVEGRVKNFVTQNPIRFVLQLLNRSAGRYLQYLRIIDRAAHRIEQELHGSLKNKELIQLLKLEKSLVYFSTSLRSNTMVLDRLARHELIRNRPEESELLDDVIVETRQALEMANIYSNTLSGTMDAFASVISNNLNIVMKVLTSVTIVMAIPTMVSSFMGMNVEQPLHGPFAFAWVMLISVVLCVAAVGLLWRNKML
ncbi:MAG: CorA family divalent cation transporter [Polyangiaceae bacterium]